MKAYVIYLALVTVQWFAFNYLKPSRGSAGADEKVRNKYFLLLSCIELIILAGIRGYTVGADTETYLSALEHYRSMSRGEILGANLVAPYDFEMGYFLLVKICAFIGLSNTTFLFLVAIIIYVPVFVAIYKMSKNPYISILTYFAFSLFAYSLGIFRQMIAVSIIICGVDFIKDRKFWRYLILVIFAMTFHTTAALALALYILYPFGWKLNAVTMSVLSLTALVFGSAFIRIIVTVFPQYSGYTDANKSGGSYLMLLLYILIFVLQCFALRGKKTESYGKITFDAMTIVLFVQSLGYSLEIFGRIIGYFSVFLLFLIPNMVETLNSRLRPVIRVGVALCLMILIYSNLHGNEYVEYYVAFLTNH